MTIAVCLLTCGREDLTRTTVAAFNACNPGAGFIRLHADDASPTLANHVIAQEGGFNTVYTASRRAGQMAGLRALVQAAERRGADWVLWLENDIETVAPFPFHALRYGAECVRLYGDRKARSGPRAPTGRHLMGTKDIIAWQPIGDGLERGEAHWAGQPSATRMHVIAGLARAASSVKGMSLLGPLDTVRVVENVCWHIGDEQTPEFMA